MDLEVFCKFDSIQVKLCYKFSGNTEFLRPPFTENTNLLGVELNHVTQIAELSHILTRPIY